MRWAPSQCQVAEVGPHLIPGHLPFFRVTHWRSSHRRSAHYFPISIARRKARVALTIRRISLQRPCIVGAGVAPPLLGLIARIRCRNFPLTLRGTKTVLVWVGVRRKLWMNDE